MKIKSKVKVLIIEDDPAWSIFVESIILESNYELVGAANTLEKAKAMIDGLKPDILISDIVLQDSTVFSLFENTNHATIPILFMTNYLEGDAYDLSLDVPQSTFLAKPFHKFTLLSTLDLLVSKYPIKPSEINNFITIRGKQQQNIKIFFDDITWMQSEGNYCFIHTAENRKYTKKISLTKILTDLDTRFIMIHKGFAINTNHIRRIDLGNKKIIVQDSILPIGRGYRESLNPFLHQRY